MISTRNRIQIVLCVVAAAALLNACRESTVDPVVVPVVAPISDPRAYCLSPVANATLKFVTNIWMIDSNGSTWPERGMSFSYVIVDTNAACPNGERGIEISVIRTNDDNRDTLTGYMSKSSRELLLITYDDDHHGSDTVSSRMLETPIEVGGHFRSNDTCRSDDMVIDSVDELVSVPAFLTPAKHGVKVIQHGTESYGEDRPDRRTSVTITTYLVPGYGAALTTTARTTTTLSTGRTTTRTEQTVLTSASY